MPDRKNKSSIVRLSDEQKNRLGILEPALRDAVRLGKLTKAKSLTLEIQNLLRPTGHETRLMQAKNLMFEAALEAGEVDYAISGFQGVRQKVAKTTRLYLESTILLSISYLRKGSLDEAAPIIDETWKRLKNIKSDKERRKLKRNITKRLEEEGVLAALAEQSSEDASAFDPDKIQREAIVILQSKSDDEIMSLIGQSTPPYVLQFLERISAASHQQLPYKEILLLTSGSVGEKSHNLGKKVYESLKRVVWKALCDPDSEVYKIWFSEGMAKVFDKKYITTAILAAMSGFRIGYYAVAVYFSALVLKTGLEGFCDVAKPASIMGTREEGKNGKR